MPLQFVNAINCSFEHIAGLSPATPQKIEDIIVSIRSDLFVSGAITGL
jgi:hypothetical protein